MLAKLLAGILGLLAFFICIAGGLIAGARAEVAIARGLEAMLIFCLLGWVVGWTADSAIQEHVRKEAQELLTQLEESKAAEAAEPTNGQSVEPQTRT